MSSSSVGVVGLTCQKCGSSLRFDLSYLNLDQHDVADLLSSPPIVTGSNDTLDNNCSVGRVGSDLDHQQSSPHDHIVVTMAGAPVETNRRVIGRLLSEESGSADFTLLEESVDPGSEESLGLRLQVLAALFDHLSGSAQIDHPLCQDCADTLLDMQDARLKSLEEDQAALLECASRLKALEPHKSKLDEIYVELDQLDEEEKILKSEMERLTSEKVQLEEEFAAEADLSTKLSQEESDLQAEYNELKRQLYMLEDAQASAENQLHYVNQQLDVLDKTNIFNFAFHIWYSGHFGTINGFRMGRLAAVPVEWSEINAGWGQCALLLDALVRRCGLQLQRYKIVPHGSLSYIINLSDDKKLQLYSNSGFRLFWDSKFDAACVAYLDCLAQLKNVIERSSGVQLPCPIPEKGKIADCNGQAFSIKTQLNSEEHWTKALKLMLTNLKWAIAWISSQSAQQLQQLNVASDASSAS